MDIHKVVGGFVEGRTESVWVVLKVEDIHMVKSKKWTSVLLISQVKEIAG